MNVRSIAKKRLPLPLVYFIKKMLNFYRYFFPVRSQLQKFNIMVTQYCMGKVDKFILPEVRDWVFANEITYCSDGLISIHSVDWMYDPKFAEAYRLAEKAGSFTSKAGLVNKVMYRVYILCWAANQAKHLEGDFIECGVSWGACSRAITHYVDFNKLSKEFYLLDTYSGFPEDSITKQELDMGITGFEYEECYDEVSRTFKDFSNVKLIRGRVPDTLPLVYSEKIAFLHIDMNCVKPEIAAGEFFWDKLVKGAFVILDDYGFYMHVHQRKAWDVFAEKRNVKILTLPTGQGLLIKN